MPFLTNPYTYAVALGFEDTFVEASPPVALASHTPNVGTSWSGVQVTGTGFIINPSGTLTTNVGTECRGDANPSPSSADCFAEASVQDGGFGGGSGGPFIRKQAGADTYYWVECYNSGIDTTLYLIKRVAGGRTSLGTTTQSLASAHLVKITASGTTIKVYVDGVEKISVTDAIISGAGDAGVRYLGGGSGNVVFHSFQCANL